MEQGSKQDSDGMFHGSNPLDKEGKSIRRNRKRMFIEWGETGIFESTEQRVCDQARPIRNNGCLSELELEVTKRQV